jgi:hypothetical protein
MKLLIYTACDRVLQDPVHGASLITVFHGLAFKVQEGIELPPNAVMPKEWAVFTKWGLEREEVGKQYVSKLEIYWPDGTEFIKFSLEALQPIRDGLMFISRITGFPVGQTGNLRILQTLESEGSIVFGPEELIIKVNDPDHLSFVEDSGQELSRLG